MTTAAIDIARKPDEVYAYVSDIANHGEWANPKAQLKVEHAAEGSYTFTSKFLGRAAGGDIRVTEAKAPERLAFVSRHTTGQPVEFVHVFTFRPSGIGTRVERSFDARGAKGIGKVLGALAAPIARADSAKTLRRLKATLERS